MKKVLTITVSLVGFLLILLGSSVQAHDFEADLFGDFEVPAVETDASGNIELTLNDDGTELAYRLRVSDIEHILFAHIHVGAEGTNGPVILFLARSAADFVDGVVRGVLTERDLIPSPANGIGTFDDALKAIAGGNTYANVHTQQNPGGEIRGQIVPAED
jgi:hypothetical protein